MGHKCFISFKKEDEEFKKEIQSWADDDRVDMIDKSLDDAIDSEDEDYIMRKIREDYLSDSSVTIFLIGAHSAEKLGKKEQKYIKRELQASLFNGKENNTRSGILGVVLPCMYDKIYKGTSTCSKCGCEHNIVCINDNTVIKEFSKNYYLNSGKCYYGEDDRYCVLVKWSDFKKKPNTYIEKAFEKRQQAIAQKVIVRPD